VGYYSLRDIRRDAFELKAENINRKLATDWQLATGNWNGHQVRWPGECHRQLKERAVSPGPIDAAAICCYLYRYVPEDR
jgi:hypothetical protein